MASVTVQEPRSEWIQIQEEEKRKQAEFDRVTDILYSLDRQIEDAEYDLKTQFRHAPSDDQNDGYSRAYRDRLRRLEWLNREVKRLEAYLESI